MEPPLPGSSRQPAVDPSGPNAGFLWSSLPPYLEKPAQVASVARVARGPHRALHDGKRLCLSHLNLHPNSLGHPDDRRDRGFEDPRANGCLARVSLCALVSVQFHLPRLGEALWLLEGLAGSSCRSLRKIVDRQSRWRPREQRFENLDEFTKAKAGLLADDLGRSLKSLKHLEGPVFSLLLRARAYRPEEPSPPPDAGAASLGGRCEALHLVDACAGDLQGLWEPLCPRLQKLVLLNLPAAAPGRTAAAVAAFLPKAPNLTELQLDFQFFDPNAWELEALEALVERVQAPPSKISKLMMEWCRLGDAGTRSVCQALARNVRKLGTEGGGVSELSLAHCELRDVGCICEMLETPGLPLTKLDLSSNALDDQQALRLAKALPLSKVKDLRLRDSLISVPLPVRTEWFWGC